MHDYAHYGAPCLPASARTTRLALAAVVAALGITASAAFILTGVALVAPAAAQTPPRVCNCTAPSVECVRYCNAWWAKDPRYCKGPAPNCYENAIGKPHARTGQPSTAADAKEWCSRPRTC
jgi:hypothetical protein